MGIKHSLLHTLSDGRFHSGEELGAGLSISRAAVWKHLQGLRKTGVVVNSVPGKGYCLDTPLELLNSDQIVNALSDRGRSLLSHLEVHESLRSTNDYLLSKALQGSECGIVCLAEHQTHGRGRRGRQWFSPFGSNIYMSIYWCFKLPPMALTGLSLVIGVAVVDALQDSGVSGVGIKWPNDLVWNGAKLGGVLVDVQGEAGGPLQVALGIGLNGNMSSHAGTERIDQPWVDLQQIADGFSRNEIAARVLDQVLCGLAQFEKRGLGPFLVDWRAHDALKGKDVIVHVADLKIEGVAAGIDEQGCLILETDQGLRRYAAGEVSVRVQQ